MNSYRHPRLAAAAFSTALLFLGGCTSGDLSQRDDGKVATAGRRQDGLTETRVQERAAQLLREHPGMSPKDAANQARSEIPMTYDAPQRTRAEIEKAKAQAKFEEELAKMKR